MSDEEWRPLPGHPGYIVSATGKLAKILKGKVHSGYQMYEIGAKDKRTTIHASRAVALAFKGPPPLPNMDAAHEDGVRSNNHYSNITWKTRRDNMLDKRRHGTQPYNEQHHWAKINMETANHIRVMYAKGGYTFTRLGKLFNLS